MNKRQKKKNRCEPRSHEPASDQSTPSRAKKAWRAWKPPLKKAALWTWEFAKAETDTWFDKALKFIFWAFFFFLLGWIMRAVLYPQRTIWTLPSGGTWHRVGAETAPTPGNEIRTPAPVKDEEGGAPKESAP